MDTLPPPQIPPPPQRPSMPGRLVFALCVVLFVFAVGTFSKNYITLRFNEDQAAGTASANNALLLQASRDLQHALPAARQTALQHALDVAQTRKQHMLQ